MIFTLGIFILRKLKISVLPTGNIIFTIINLLQMFYQTRYPSANKWATLCSFKVNAVYQKLAQNLWVKRYGGSQLSQQSLFFSRQNHFRGHGKSIYTHSKTTFHHGEIILANLLTCRQHAKCYGNNPTCPALSLSSRWNFFSLPIQVTISIRTHVLTLIVSKFSPYFSVPFTIKTISYLENVRSLIFFFLFVVFT